MHIAVPRRINAVGWDAKAIRVSALVLISMVKLLRAYGECLGDRCR
jgi:hypothetical protein